jgi:cell division protein FtsI/penicillin-binding protein 2
MFERRLKTLFALLVAMAILLLLRAVQVQVVNASHWRQEAARNMQRTQLLPTIRGDIVDARGRKLATDEPCIDAAVDYRAIIRQPEWMRQQVRQRLRGNAGYRRADKAGRAQILQEEHERLVADLDGMWRTLAEVSVPPRSLDEIELVKASIRREVDVRRRIMWYSRFRRAMADHEQRAPAPWYRDWLLSDQPAPEVDNYSIEVAEQTEAHVIVPAISSEVHNFLRKQIDRFPGLVLRPSKHRTYPFGAVASHVLGNLGIVSAEDMK